MEKKELAKRINVSLATIYNWEKTKPELIKLVKKGIENEKNLIKNENEINEYFNRLSEKEKEMYRAEIKARVLKKEIDKN